MTMLPQDTARAIANSLGASNDQHAHEPDALSKLIHEALGGLVAQMSPTGRVSDRALAEALAEKLIADVRRLLPALEGQKP